MSLKLRTMNNAFANKVNLQKHNTMLYHQSLVLPSNLICPHNSLRFNHHQRSPLNTQTQTPVKTINQQVLLMNIRKIRVGLHIRKYFSLFAVFAIYVCFYIEALTPLLLAKERKHTSLARTHLEQYRFQQRIHLKSLRQCLYVVQYN